MFFLAMAICGIVIGFAVGRHRLTGLLLGSYVAIAILEAIPANELFGYAYAKAIVFLVLLVVFTLMDVYFFGTLFSSNAAWQWIILSILETGMLLAVCTRLLPQRTVKIYVPETLFYYFSDGWAHVFWIVAPLVFLFLINRSK